MILAFIACLSLCSARTVNFNAAWNASNATVCSHVAPTGLNLGATTQRAQADLWQSFYKEFLAPVARQGKQAAVFNEVVLKRSPLFKLNSEDVERIAHDHGVDFRTRHLTFSKTWTFSWTLPDNLEDSACEIQQIVDPTLMTTDAPSVSCESSQSSLWSIFGMALVTLLLHVAIAAHSSCRRRSTCIDASLLPRIATKRIVQCLARKQHTHKQDRIPGPVATLINECVGNNDLSLGIELRWRAQQAREEMWAQFYNEALSPVAKQGFTSFRLRVQNLRYPMQVLGALSALDVDLVQQMAASHGVKYRFSQSAHTHHFSW
eukprot:TRINITY_DN67146_c0_g1_i1.p1 TRINITY_DN67146_c0_g1~~TRINITY_DN67146_c0_g1_i1.p1  ORF type:complete len:319 (+),score=11.64 TRINITY_DN67146_c0_g1_i1:60-1016(+)